MMTYQLEGKEEEWVCELKNTACHNEDSSIGGEKEGEAGS
jgi:hypothetical protein